jgi:hypothetical protein
MNRAAELSAPRSRFSSSQSASPLAVNGVAAARHAAQGLLAVVAGTIVNTIKTILLYGDSLWFAGLAAYLQASQGLCVIQSDPRSLAEIAGHANLDLVILDRTQEADALPLLRVHPAATVVSVDTHTGILTALSGRSCQVQTMQEVEQLIRDLMAA